MKKLLLLFFTLLGICTFSTAQVIPQKEMKDLVILKFSPLPFFDFDNTVQLGVEVPLKNRRLAIHQELGYGHSVFNPWYFEWKGKPYKTTFRTRSQFRFYLHEWSSGRLYLSGEYFGKRVTASEERWLGANCDGCDYLELKEVTKRKLVHAVHAKIGWHFYFSNRVTLDLYTGGGLRVKSFKTTPANGGHVDLGKYGWLDDFDWDYNTLLPSIAAGFQIGIPLNGKSK